MPIQSVLVVDDSKTEQLLMRQILESAGLHVRCAGNADEALEALAQGKPDLILMDVVMPGQNGFQLTRSIAKSSEYGQIPVIICTSKNQETDRVWGLRQGAKDYLTKPIKPSELLGKIKALGALARSA